MFNTPQFYEDKLTRAHTAHHPDARERPGQAPENRAEEQRQARHHNSGMGCCGGNTKMHSMCLHKSLGEATVPTVHDSHNSCYHL
mmetsp:Transcript_72918/g.133340  ORF Transcript_72918/g.133340 Transcript_72918/m.133340 type:complete len:85 (-) Transcript_72918:10-264(-)